MKKNNEFRQHLKEQRQEESRKLKSMTFPQKLDYIWTYYKAPILITLSILILVIYTVHHLVTNNQESILYTMVLNANGQDSTHGDDLFDTFLLEQGYNLDDYMVERNTSIYLTQTESGDYSDPQMFSALYTLLMSGSVDNVLASEDLVQIIAEAGYFMPLSEYLSEEEIAKYEEENRVLYALDPVTNENTAFCISLESYEKVENASLFSKTPYFGMLRSAPHQENCISFLHYLME